MVKYHNEPPKTLRQWADQHSDVIEEISTEGVDGYWLYLKPGWIDIEAGTHQLHEYTVERIKQRFKDYVRREG